MPGGLSARQSVQAPTQSHSHTHSVKASVLAGVAKPGPASLPPPAGVRGENPSGGFSNRLKWEKLATEERAGPQERRGGRQARASEASLQARRLPWEVTQLRLGALTTYPLENGGQKEYLGLNALDNGLPQWLSTKESTCNAGDTRYASSILE